MKKSIYNPHGVATLIREYKHEPEELLRLARSGGLEFLRGGVRTADHVDIMGNYQMLEDILHIVSGTGEPPERILSDLDRIVQGVQL